MKTIPAILVLLGVLLANHARAEVNAVANRKAPDTASRQGVKDLETEVQRADGYTEIITTGERAVLRIVFRSPGPSDAYIGQLAPLLQKSPMPIDLNINQSGITDAGVAHLKDIQTLHSLGLGGTKVTDAGLKHVGELTKLEELYLSNDKLTDAGLAHLSKLTRMRKLSIYSEGVTDAGYAHLKGMTQLEELHVGGIGHGLGDTCLSHLAGMSRLKELRLESKDLTDKGMAYLKNLPEVRIVRLEGQKVTRAGAAHLAALKKLEELTVLSCNGLDDEGLSAIKDLKNLRVLELIYARPVTKKGSAALAGLTSLQKLRLGSVEEDGLAGLSNLANLEELDMNFSRVDDANLAHISGLKNLKNLDLQSTPVTDAGMKHLRGLSGLRELWIQDDKITDEGFKQLAPLSGLERIFASNCKITGSAFKDMRTMTGLKELWMGGNPITDANVMALKDLPGLKRIKLTGTEVSEEAAFRLKQARSELEVVDVTGTEVTLEKPPERPRPVIEDLTKSPPDFKLTAIAFQKEFKEGNADARKKYEGKVIELSGEVSGINRNISGESNITLHANSGLFGQFCFTADDEPWAKVVPGQKVKVKGKLAPYGDALIYCVFTETGKYGGIEMPAAELGRQYEADSEATGKKYKDKYLILTGEVVKKEYNSAGAVGIVLKTPGKLRVIVSFTAFEKDLSRSIKVGQKIKVIGQYTLNYDNDKVQLYFCMPFKQPQ